MIWDRAPLVTANLVMCGEAGWIDYAVVGGGDEGLAVVGGLIEHVGPASHVQLGHDVVEQQDWRSVAGLTEVCGLGQLHCDYGGASLAPGGVLARRHSADIHQQVVPVGASYRVALGRSRGRGAPPWRS